MNVALRVVVAAGLIAGAVALSAQTRPAEERLAALEASQKEILKQLAELKLMIAQLRQPMPPPAAAAAPSAAGAPRPAGAVPPGLAIPTTPIPIDGAASRGSTTAKVTLVEFSDFQCPFCGRYSRDTFEQIVRDYVDTGKVRYVFKNFPIESLHPRAFRSAQAGECAKRQGKFWDLHTRLFANQSALGEPDFIAHARLIGLDTNAFASCLAGDSTTARIRQDMTDGRPLSITGTPAFFFGTAQGNSVRVQRRLTGAKSYAEFKANIDVLLAQPAGQ